MFVWVRLDDYWFWWVFFYEGNRLEKYVNRWIVNVGWQGYVICRSDDKRFYTQSCGYISNGKC